MSAPELLRSPLRPADLLLRDVRLLDPREDIDARHDLLVRGGSIAELAAPGTLTPGDDFELVEGQGRLSV
ncbi:MAG TPA: hypothetical protein VGI76_01150, partial [Solirubrobacteraceae bacterium]